MTILALDNRSNYVVHMSERLSVHSNFAWDFQCFIYAKKTRKEHTVGKDLYLDNGVKKKSHNRPDV